MIPPFKHQFETFKKTQSTVCMSCRIFGNCVFFDIKGADHVSNSFSLRAFSWYIWDLLRDWRSTCHLACHSQRKTLSARPIRHAGGLCLGTHWRISGSKTALSSGFVLRHRGDVPDFRQSLGHNFLPVRGRICILWRIAGWSGCLAALSASFSAALWGLSQQHHACRSACSCIRANRLFLCRLLLWYPL